MKICIITNEDKDINLEYTKRLIEFIIQKKATPLIPKAMEKYINESLDKITFLEYDSIFKICDFIVILGGDGTILSWAINIAKYNKSILGINMGNLGYLTDVEKADGFTAISKVLKNDYTIENRMMLDVEVDGQNYIALNEVNVNNGNLAKMISIGIDINNQTIDKFRADGVIICTPTGSTAYNLSAGGPILKSDTELIAITYVCPHKLFSRPFVISSKDNVLVYTINEEAFLSIDGRINLKISPFVQIRVKKSDFYTKIIKTTNFNFYDILRMKMLEGGSLI